MRTLIATLAVAASLMGSAAEAQLFNRNKPSPSPAPVDSAVKPASVAGSAPGTVDPKTMVYKNNAELPAATIPGGPQIRGPLPDGPIEPYMLDRRNGPFMVMAYAFRGPEAPRQALALVLELRNQYKLPAYILMAKKFPGKSNIRGVPRDRSYVTKDDVGLPELLRTLDEAAVLVGDEKTIKDATDLMHRVKKIHPVCLDGAPNMLPWRQGKGLKQAMRTTNPFVPAEELFARTPDVLVSKMNDGPHNIRYCPGKYTLQIATFSGRSTFDPKNDPRFMGVMAALKSPLATAADDAERLAEALSKDKEISKLGYQPYVYHDRYSSKVTIGSFDSTQDPAARKLHDRLLELAVDLNNRKVTDTMIVPAGALMDLTPIKPNLDSGPAATARN